MSEFSVSIFYSQIQRLPWQKVQELLKKYENNLKKMSFVDVNQIFNFLDSKVETIERWQQSNGMIDILTFKKVAERIPVLSRYTFEEIDNMNELHPTIQVEVAFILSESERMNLLKNFGNRLNSLLIQELILALSKDNQKRMMFEFKDIILSVEHVLLLSFLACLDCENQKVFLSIIKEKIRKMKTEQIVSIVLGVYNSNISYLFKEYYEIINDLDDKDILSFLSMLNGDGLVLFNEIFKSRIDIIPADVLMYRLGTSIEDCTQIYNIWKTNQNKLSELSDNYFNLVISRLDDNSRLSSLSDFKDRYNKMGTSQLLDLFEFDKDEYKYTLFVEYPDKMNELDNRKFIEYINENISNPDLRNKLFLVYKDKICKMDDEDFIYFITSYSEKNLKYVFSAGDLNEKKAALVDYIFDNFVERLKSIQIANIPSLFNDSNACLQHKYLEVLNDNIKKLILDKTYIEKLLRAVWGDARIEILEAFPEELGSLGAQDWYKLQSVIGDSEFKAIEKYLLSCRIDNFDFVDNDTLLNSSKLRRMFYYFEQNVQGMLLDEYTKLVENQENDKLLAIYEEVMTQVIDEDSEYVLSSYSSINLLVLLRVLLKYNIINNQDEYYLMFKELYMNKLLSKLEKENEENVNLIKDSLFYRLIKGSVTSTSLMSIKTLKGLLFFNKNVISLTDRKNIQVYAPVEIEKFVVNLTEEQVVGLNNKLFRQVCSYLFDRYKEDTQSREQVRNLAIRLYMSVGYKNAKRLIDLHVDFTRYEFIFNGIDIKRIKINENGEPVINKRLMDFMFGSNMNDENTNINRLLQDKIPGFERRFAEIYNGWETISQNLNGNVTVARILKWFEDNKILLNPDEYRLSAVIGEIGNDEKNLAKARELYADMKRRKFSTIPKVFGRFNDEYTYEMLDLDDPLGLVVGYITRCCFLIDGASSSALFHSAQSKDGRIFVVRKNGELVAQSWVWRNGNLVCFDNVETRGSYDSHILLDTYKQASQDILAVSLKDESTKEQIKLVTFGGGYSKISKPSEKVPRNQIRTPRVEQRVYTDAEYEQFILASNGESELYYGDVKAQYIDGRNVVQRYSRLSLLEREDKSKIIKKIREIDYIKNSTIRDIDFEGYKYVVIADDWYLLLTNNGEVECILLETDERAREEIYDEIDHLPEIFNGMGISDEVKSVSGKVLALVNRSCV